MKWPASIMLIRHDTSAYNILRDKKKNDPLYQCFLKEYRENPTGKGAQYWAQKVKEKFALGVSDANTDLADAEGKQAVETGRKLSSGELPDIIFVSPYLRAVKTLEHIKTGWPELKQVKTVKEKRVREQEHGLALLYNDWKVFFSLNPLQKELYDLEGPVNYRYPQGENVPDVCLRNQMFLSTLTRDFPEKRILIVTHHLNILAMMSNLDRWDDEKFIHMDENEKPINCGVTLYRGIPGEGKDGRLKREYYNEQLY